MQYQGASTPPPGVQFGGFWIRFVAYFVDAIIIGIPIWILMAVIGGGAIMGAASMGEDPDPAALMAALGPIFLLIPLAFIVSWLYEALMTATPAGGTVGKRMLGLRVVREDGTQLSFGRATGRFFAKILNAFIPFYIGFMMAGFTDKKRALHDMIAATYVIKR